MSGVYIKGLEMPLGCFSCGFESEVSYYCTILQKPTTEANNKEERRPDCPLVAVPDHGDLIDAQEQMRLMQSCEYDTYNDYNRAFDMLDCAPTIIPADKEAPT